MSWAHYILQVNIYLLVFYGFYKLLLDKETYFTLNRIYLVSAGLFALAIPFLRFEWFSKQTVVQPVYISAEQFMTQVSIVQEESNGFSIGNLIVLVYLIGALFFAVRFIFRIRSVVKKLKHHESGQAFSFLSQKRIDSNLPQIETVHKHEDAHIRQWHSIDVLFFELLSIFTWFNPVIYWYKYAIKSIHEYLADEEAAKFQGDKEQYALLLLGSAFGVQVNALTNSFFNKSLIKRRIFMLHKQRSRKVAILKYGLAIPLFAIALVLSSATIRNNEKIQRITDNIPLNTPIEAVNEVVTASIEPIAPQLAKKMQINGHENNQETAGWDEFYKFMKKSLRYPVSAHKSKIMGTTMIKFTVAGGQIENVGIATKLGGGCDAEALRNIVLFPDYKSIKDGKYTLKVKFMLQDLEDPNAPILNEKIADLKGYTTLDKITIIAFGGKAVAATNDNDKVYDFVSIETAPGFPGGMQGFYAYLKDNVKYPEEALKNNVQGKVFLSFIVEKDGSLNDIKVERKLGSGTDEEAIRVLRESPKWIPGTQAGKAVRVKYNIPISFSKIKPQAPPSDQQDKQGSTIVPSGNSSGIQFRDSDGGEIRFGDKPGTEPLVILDGKTADMSTMKNLKPDAIESMSVLKDAKATSIYGEKGANGVILITTKSIPLSEVVIREVKKDN